MEFRGIRDFPIPRPFKFIYIEQVLGFSSAAPRLANCPIFLGNSREHLLGMCHGEMVLEVNAEVPTGVLAVAGATESTQSLIP